MSGLIFGIVQIFWLLYALITFAAVSRAVKAETRDHKKWQVGLTVLFYFAIVPVGLGGYNWYIEWDARKRNEAVNERFTKRCKEDARVTIKRVVENVDGVFIMKPRKVATGTDFQDQFWMGDPYGYSDFEAKHPSVFLSYASFGQYRFVELPNPDFGKKPDELSIIRLEGRDLDSHGDYRESDKKATSKRESRYGFDWDDISTPEDRKYWIAGGRLRIIDLATNEVIAEKIGYLVDPMQGGRVGGDTWRFSNRNSCPEQSQDVFKTREFLFRVLIPTRRVENGK